MQVARWLSRTSAPTGLFLNGSEIDAPSVEEADDQIGKCTLDEIDDLDLTKRLRRFER